MYYLEIKVFELSNAIANVGSSQNMIVVCTMNKLYFYLKYERNGLLIVHVPCLTYKIKFSKFALIDFFKVAGL
jgi:hypothetical protein